MNRVVSVAGIGVCLAGAALLSAQDQIETRLEGTFEHKVEGRTFTAQAMPAQIGIAGQAGTFHWVGAGPGLEGQLVKNAPYSAEGVTETGRTLADGTKISQKSRTKVYRDTEGRTRREQTLGAIGEWSAAGEPPTIISISNPAAGETYILNTRDKTAQKMKVNIDVRPALGVKALQSADVLMMAPTQAMVVDRAPAAVGKETVVAHRAMRAEMGGVAAGPNIMFFGDSDAKRESLGERNIEGVMAQGTKTTSTIPVGKIGNDRPISVVHESWYSPELQTVVLSETKDPMSGDVTYRLMNIQRSNPPASLFEIPPDYKVQEGGMLMHKIEREKIERDRMERDNKQ